MRPIIEAGRLYKVYSPLYQLEDKNDPYAANKAEMVERHHKNIIKAYSVQLEADSKPLTKDELKEFLSDTYEYRKTLIRAAKSSGNVNKFLLEAVIAHLVLMGFVTWHPNKYDKFSGYFEMKDIEKEFSNQKFVATLMRRLQKQYPEIRVTENGTFYAVVNGIYTQIKVSPRLFKKAEGLLPIISEYGYILKAKGKSTDNVHEYTIAEFMDRCQSLTAKIHARIKGLGELDAEDLRAAAMDINNRISVQFTVDDVEKELEIFYMTHGGSPEDLQRRKKMMKEYHIRREDLDN